MRSVRHITKQKRTQKLDFLDDFVASKTNVLPWPSQSPDLNPIENLWVKLNDECKDRKCKNEEELFQVLKEAWEKLDGNYLKALVDSMPARIEAVIKSKGYPTKY